MTVVLRRLRSCRWARAQVRQDLASPAGRDVRWHPRRAPGHGGGRQASHAAPRRWRASATSTGGITLSYRKIHGERARSRRSARAAVRPLSGCRRRRSVDLRAGWSSPSRGSSADSGRAAASLVPCLFVPFRAQGGSATALPYCLRWDRRRAGITAMEVVTTLVRVWESARLVSAAEPGRRGADRAVGGQVMRVAWYCFTATFGRRRGGYLAVVLLIGLAGGIAMGSVAAARRTQASFATFLASTNPSDLSLSLTVFAPDLTKKL